MTLHLTRATLRQDANVGAILPILMSAKKGAAHNLIWSVTSDGPDRQRDYLWRSADPSTFYVLSDRVPPGGPLYDVASVALPEFEVGDRLAFSLRANPVIRRRVRGPDRPAVKVDPIMHRLHGMPQQERALKRMEIAQEEVNAWLTRLGEAGGYTLGATVVESYRQERVGRRGEAPVRFSVVEVSGLLTVTDPAAFEERLRQGFGSARAWGCGLMLTRRL